MEEIENMNNPEPPVDQPAAQEAGVLEDIISNTDILTSLEAELNNLEAAQSISSKENEEALTGTLEDEIAKELAPVPSSPGPPTSQASEENQSVSADHTNVADIAPPEALEESKQASDENSDFSNDVMDTSIAGDDLKSAVVDSTGHNETDSMDVNESPLSPSTAQSSEPMEVDTVAEDQVNGTEECQETDSVTCNAPPTEEISGDVSDTQKSCNEMEAVDNGSEEQERRQEEIVSNGQQELSLDNQNEVAEKVSVPEDVEQNSCESSAKDPSKDGGMDVADELNKTSEVNESVEKESTVTDPSSAEPEKQAEISSSEKAFDMLMSDSTDAQKTSDNQEKTAEDSNAKDTGQSMSTAEKAFDMLLAGNTEKIPVANDNTSEGVNDSYSRDTGTGPSSPASSMEVDGDTASVDSSHTQKITMSKSLMPTTSSSGTQADDGAAEDAEVIIIPHDANIVEESEKPSDVAVRASALELVSVPLTQLCAQCKQIKPCCLRLGTLRLCSDACYQALSLQTAEALAQRSCAQCRTTLPCSRIHWQTMDFCNETCVSQYIQIIGLSCAHCRKFVSDSNQGKFCIRFGCDIKQFCDAKCLDKHKEGLRLCSFCQIVMTLPSPIRLYGKDFCASACQTNYERVTRRGSLINSTCAVCSQVKPVNVEMQQGTKLTYLCSDPCFAAFKFVNNIINEGRCDQCQKFFDTSLTEKIRIFVSDRPVHFCTKSCLNIYILETRRIKACMRCRVKKYDHDMICVQGSTPTFACSMYCLEDRKAKEQWNKLQKQLHAPTNVAKEVAPVREIFQNIVVKPPEPKDFKNKAILCKPLIHNKGTSCRPMTCHKEVQTCDSLNPPVVIPIPVPIYIPTPTLMWSAPFPIPIPVPVALPIPIFIPTTRNSAKGIMKEIRKIHDKMPADPFEAELLMMAEMVAGVKKQEATDSESDGEGNDVANDVPESYSPEAVDTANSFGEDIMQMALFGSDLAEPQVDMESVLTSNTITPQESPMDQKNIYGVQQEPEDTQHMMAAMRGRKRPMRGTSPRGGANQQSKRGRRSTTPNDHSMHHNMGMGHHMPPPEPQRIEVEKPDANMRLKYTFGVNAWRHWVMQKNQDLEKAMILNRKIKPFKPDLLQLTADELNFSLCLFVKEVKKPNGQEYAPDTIYYLCLGIQQYLFENGRIDNIFTDMYYEKFTDCLDEVAKKFAALYDDSHYIVTRVEEEHLWESKQLGAHSPHVLLSTLMFFNTKHFNLVTVEEHMQLSFSHIMKHWKRNPNAPGVAKVPGSRNVLLRFYPPQSALEANSRKKKVYEQQENEENPLRCPVKLYEFYLSKCPESVKTRNDVFYLLPERSCVPDSPVWYSTMALGKEPLMKMLHRVKMVKEINVALLTS